MYLNVHAVAPEGAGIPKTPEILNSLISLTSPPPPPLRPSQEFSTTALLSPNEESKSWQHLTEPDEGLPLSGDPHNPRLPDPHSSVHPPLYPYQSPSSHLLTPISDSAPSPDGGGGGFQPHLGPPPPLTSDLASPVSTVEATRSALIKEGLKLTITSKLQQGAASTPVSEAFFVPDTTVVKTEQLTAEDEERRRRRRERNKVAATKCRNKKKEMTEILISESETVEEVNIRLKNEFRRLTEEKTRLQAYLSDESHRTSCKHSRRSKLTSQRALTSSSPPPSSGAKMTSPSNYSPSSSPCSFSSLMSPSDSKDFITNVNLSGSNSVQCTSTNEDFESSTPTLSTLNVSCVATSLENIEATIPSHDTASKTLSWSNCKPTQNYSSSCRYQPYGNWEHSRKLNHIVDNPHLPIERMTNDSYCPTKSLDNANNNYYRLLDPASTMYDQDKAISLFEKINPFKYPCTNKSSIGTQKQSYSQPSPFQDLSHVNSNVLKNCTGEGNPLLPTSCGLFNDDSIQCTVYDNVLNNSGKHNVSLTVNSTQNCSYTNL